MAVIETGSNATGTANVTVNNELVVALGNTPATMGGAKIFSENDAGTKTGTPYLQSPETDDDYRLRVAQDNFFENEIFNYTAQNTGKYKYLNTTMAATWAASGLLANSGNITTTSTGLLVQSYAYFSFYDSIQAAIQWSLSFSAQQPSNVIDDFGFFLTSGANPYAPSDGVFFRVTAAGVIGVLNYNGVETTTSVFDFAYIANHKYNFLIVCNPDYVEFWIDNVLYAELETPTGQGTPFMSSALPWSYRKAIVGGAAGAVSTTSINQLYVSLGGIPTGDKMGEVNNRIIGSYQGLSGGTMGSLSVYTNSTNPTAAVPANTALTANLPSGLGGQAWETFTTGLAANVDGILMSYQVPAGTVNFAGKRLKIVGVKMSAFVQAALTGGGFNSTFTLAFGHTAVSLATAEAATTKARRIVLLPELTQTVPAAAAALTLVSQLDTSAMFPDSPIYVNPGEFVAFCVKHIGTVASAGVIAYNIQYVYSWE